MGAQKTGAQSKGLPIQGDLKWATRLSLLAAVMMTGASAAGLLYENQIYSTAELALAFVPNDVVNLVIGLPILLGSQWLARRGKLVGLLSWPGALFYLFYTYLVYLLGMPFNLLFPIYMAIVPLSAYLVIALVAMINGQAVKAALEGVVPERMSAAVLIGLGSLFVARVLAVMGSALAGQSEIAGVELALLVTDFLACWAWIIGGALLWRRKALGYVTGAGLLFQGSMLFIGLIVVLVLQPLLTGGPFLAVDIVVVFLMGMVCFVPFGLFLRGVILRPTPQI